MTTPSPQDLRRLIEAQQLLELGQVEPARQALSRLLQKHPAQPDACAMMSVICQRTGDAPRSLYFAQRAAEGPDVRYARNLVQLELLGADASRAVAAADRLVARFPGDAELLALRVRALSHASRFAPALHACREGLAAHPDHPSLLREGVLVCHEMGRLDEGVELARRGASASPEDPLAQSLLCHALHYPARVEPRTLADEHAEFGRRLARTPTHGPLAFAGSWDPGRPLRVALISGDFRTHSVAYFIEPWMEGRDRANFHLTCFATGTRSDATTRRLASLADAFVRVGEMPAAPLADAVRAARPDVAIELSGHTWLPSLGAMRHRVAPVQATYLGYAGTTGVAEIDARLVDSLTDPPGSERLATERLVRLDPCFLCYRAPADAPDVATPTSAQDSAVRFGSFNAAAKLNRPTLELWSRVLARVPGSRLVLKSTSFLDPGLREECRGRFVSWGADPARLDLLEPGAGVREHLEQYRDVDVALDTHPYHGTTTTCEALHMGVPVVTLVGHHHAARVGLSLLASVGLPDLAAHSPEAFVEVAGSLARDAARRAELRRTLRSRLAASPLRDEPAFCRRFESCLRGLWRERAARG